MRTYETESTDRETGASAQGHQIAVFAVPDDIEPLETILMSLPDMDGPTVRQIILSLPGLIPATLTRNEAADAAARIRELGVHAMSIPKSDIQDMSHVLPVHHVKVAGNAFEVIDFRDDSRSWTVSEIYLVSVGVLPSSGPGHNRPAPALAMGNSHRIWNEGSHLDARKRPEALVVLRDSSVLGFASDEMNYEYLGDRMSTSSGANFMTLIRDIRKAATNAWITPSTRSFVEHAPMRHFEFRTREDFRHYTQFQALLSVQILKSS